MLQSLHYKKLGDYNMNAKFYVNDAVDRYDILDEDVTLHSKNGSEITARKSEPIKEVLLYRVEVECEIEQQESDIYDEKIINNVIKSLFVLYGEQCLLNKDFIIKECKKHFPVMKIKDIKVEKLEKFYKKSVSFRGKVTDYSSSITSYKTEESQSE